MQWWQDAVLYETYVRSFSDSDDDGVGDLDGVRSRLGYLELLGVDALCLTSVAVSPMVDHGYDVADPRAVDPVFGGLDAFDRLLEAAHEQGVRVLVDLVPNHTSTEHPWFNAALDAAPGSPERARYHFSSGAGDDPPNNWQSVFGGPAWTQVGDGDWYLHLLGPEQPDLNWANGEVWADFEKTMGFWLDRGVDGFRIDTAHGLAKAPGLPDAAHQPGRMGVTAPALDDPRFDQDAVHEIHRQIRAALDQYPDRVVLGEVWVEDPQRYARYARPDELHLAVDYRLARSSFAADSVKSIVESTMTALAANDGSHTAWMLSNRDVSRPPTRYGGGQRGTARAMAMMLVVLALPGAVVLGTGDELGLPDAVLPDELLQDPIWERSGRTDRGRDGGRLPMPWEGGPPGYGFTASAPWLPMPAAYGELSVATQLEDLTSTLSLMRRALELRRSHPGFRGPGVEWFGAPAGCLAFRRTGTDLVCALNTSGFPVPLPPGKVLLASGPLDDDLLPPDTAVWLA